jgi:hypothetical protein
LFSDTDIKVILSEDVEYMNYNLNTNTIRINPNTFGKSSIGYNATSFLHELVHAYTSRSLYKVETK